MKVVCIGNSHLSALSRAAIEDWRKGEGRSFDLFAGRLGSPAYTPTVDSEGALNTQLKHDLTEASRGRSTENLHQIGKGCDPTDRNVLISLIGGNAHNLLALLEPARPFDFILQELPDLPLDIRAERLSEAEVAAVLEQAVKREVEPILTALTRSVGGEIWHLESPPPIRSNEHILNHLDERFSREPKDIRVSSPSLRYKLWRLHSAAVRNLCAKLGVRLIERPEEGVDQEGYLRPEHVPGNATHAAASYGRLQLDQIESALRRDDLSQPPDNPYRRMPDAAFWGRAVARPAIAGVRPLKNFPFRISPNDRVATAGSCFAQHIARRLASSGFRYHVVENGHPMLGENLRRKFNYGTFSARYANIYTSRQLLQLIERAEGRFKPLADWWEGPDGGYVDPFRPTIQPNGFSSIEELHSDRERHLFAVRRMFREMDVFVFTLGLTETWIDRRDGATFPLCPGVSGGIFDAQQHTFLNLSVDEVRDDLRSSLKRLREIRPELRIILTVSPVPLKATASDDHVLSATTYSKSVLRVAAQDITAEFDNVGYFPSYEIITGNYTRGAYYEEDLREVRPEGVAHVMRVFFEEVTTVNGSAQLERRSPSRSDSSGLSPASQTVACQSDEQNEAPKVHAAKLECEEELLEFDNLMAERTAKF